jgi:hypothetical protein
MIWTWWPLLALGACGWTAPAHSPDGRAGTGGGDAAIAPADAAASAPGMWMPPTITLDLDDDGSPDSVVPSAPKALSQNWNWTVYLIKDGGARRVGDIKGAGDGRVEALPTKHAGLHDLQVGSFLHHGIEVDRLVFDGNSYRAVSGDACARGDTGKEECRPVGREYLPRVTGPADRSDCIDAVDRRPP